MRSRLLLLLPLALVLAGCTETAVVQSYPPPPAPVYAAEPPPPPPPPPVAAAPEPPPELSPLEQLCAPIALYPDPLIALVLPASTFPDQIQNAANYLRSGGDPNGIDQMPWDNSVKGLSHYPSVVEWMGANGNWTVQLGGSFAHSPGAVMDAIQDLRRRAQAAGTLTNTAQQQVVVYQNTLEIMPEQADVIYVPQYDPAVVYVQQPYGYGPSVFFGWSQPYRAGVWLNFDFDWRAHAVYTGDWYHYHQAHGGWARPVDYARINMNVQINNYHGWQPPHNAPPPPQQSRFVQPRVIAGAPRPPAQAARVHAIEQSRPGPRPAMRPANTTPANHPQSKPANQPPPKKKPAPKKPVPKKAPPKKEEEHPADHPDQQHPPQQN